MLRVGWAWLLVGAAGAGEPDAAYAVRDWLHATGRVAVEEPIKVWYQLELPLDDLRIVLAKVVRGGREEGGWTCFVRMPPGAEATLWCDPERTFAEVVAAYGLGATPERLSDFDWLRFYLLSVGGGCGDAGDLAAIAPGIGRRVLSRIPEPEVARPEGGGVELTLTCLAGGLPQRVDIAVDPSSAVEIRRTEIPSR